MSSDCISLASSTACPQWQGLTVSAQALQASIPHASVAGTSDFDTLVLDMAAQGGPENLHCSFSGPVGVPFMQAFVCNMLTIPDFTGPCMGPLNPLIADDGTDGSSASQSSSQPPSQIPKIDFSNRIFHGVAVLLEADPQSTDASSSSITAADDPTSDDSSLPTPTTTSDGTSDTSPTTVPISPDTLSKTATRMCKAQCDSFVQHYVKAIANATLCPSVSNSAIVTRRMNNLRTFMSMCSEPGFVGKDADSPSDTGQPADPGLPGDPGQPGDPGDPGDPGPPPTGDPNATARPSRSTHFPTSSRTPKPPFNPLVPVETADSSSGGLCKNQSNCEGLFGIIFGGIVLVALIIAGCVIFVVRRRIHAGMIASSTANSSADSFTTDPMAGSATGISGSSSFIARLLWRQYAPEKPLASDGRDGPHRERHQNMDELSLVINDAAVLPTTVPVDPESGRHLEQYVERAVLDRGFLISARWVSAMTKVSSFESFSPSLLEHRTGRGDHDDLDDGLDSHSLTSSRDSFESLRPSDAASNQSLSRRRDFVHHTRPTLTMTLTGAAPAAERPLSTSFPAAFQRITGTEAAFTAAVERRASLILSSTRGPMSLAVPAQSPIAAAASSSQTAHPSSLAAVIASSSLPSSNPPPPQLNSTRPIVDESDVNDLAIRLLPTAAELLRQGQTIYQCIEPTPPESKRYIRLRVGDQLTVLDTYPDGDVSGVNLVSGEQGLFPMGCISVLQWPMESL
eukprot:jgi/Hompol1/5482/HPOL_000921-RA